MEQDNLLLIVAIVAVSVAIVGVGITYNYVNVFNNLLTGFVVENGTVNVSIQTTASINITSANGTAGKMLDWGAGAFSPGVNYVTLISNGTVIGGSWGNITEGFIVENIGNVNVTVQISSSSNAADFLGT